MSQPAQPQFSLRGAVDLSGLGQKPPASSGTADPGSESGPSPYVVDVTDTNFQQVVEGSASYVVLLLIWLPADPTCRQLAADLATIAAEKSGAFQLARVDADAAPNIARALQAQGVPMVVGVLAGQPVPLFQGTAPIEQIRQVVDQVLEAAEANGVTGTAPAGVAAQDQDEQASEEAAAAPLPPLHQEAYDAIEAGNLEAAVAAYEKALRDDPRDVDAEAGLAQVNLLLRARDIDSAAARQAAAQNAEDVAAQLAVADLDMAGGKVADALERLLDTVSRVFGDERETIRLRLVEYFALLGADDPRVTPARRKLAAALY
ncbi:putative thioredoxin [Micrococcales bacterium KH10]|nr:putative thioredoxin [Micrococcales bacterium KH10]